MEARDADPGQSDDAAPPSGRSKRSRSDARGYIRSLRESLPRRTCAARLLAFGQSRCANGRRRLGARVCLGRASSAAGVDPGPAGAGRVAGLHCGPAVGRPFRNQNFSGPSAASAAPLSLAISPVLHSTRRGLRLRSGMDHCGLHADCRSGAQLGPCRRRTRLLFQRPRQPRLSSVFVSVPGAFRSQGNPGGGHLYSGMRFAGA